MNFLTNRSTTNKTNSWIAGIDYSVTSPAVCVHPLEQQWSFANCRFLAIPDNNKKSTDSRFDVERNLGSKADPTDRYAHNARVITTFLEKNCVTRVLIEDYAFAAKGRVFHIGENCGLLKYYLRDHAIDFSAVSPRQVKQFATQSGAATKDTMYDMFVEEAHYDLLTAFGSKNRPKKLPSPVDDIVDAYYICKYFHDRLNNAPIYTRR